MNPYYLLDFRLTLVAATISVLTAAVQRFRGRQNESTDTWWLVETTIYCWAVEATLLSIGFCESWGIHVPGDSKATHWAMIVAAVSQPFVALLFVLAAVVVSVYLRSTTLATAWCNITISFGAFIAVTAVFLDWVTVFFFAYIARFYLS